MRLSFQIFERDFILARGGTISVTDPKCFSIMSREKKKQNQPRKFFKREKFFVSHSSKKYQFLIRIISVRLTLKQFDTAAYFLKVEMPDGKKIGCCLLTNLFCNYFFPLICKILGQISLMYVKFLKKKTFCERRNFVEKGKFGFL